MLSLRIIIVSSVLGICLWGLFALLDNLKEPALLRTKQGIVVKGCSTLDAHDLAPKLCPQLLCQKALFDRKLMTLDDRVDIVADEAQGPERIVDARLVGKSSQFRCNVSGVAVTNVEPLGTT